MTCKDCVHYDVCKELRYGDITNCDCSGCGGLFKNKADFVEVEAIKSWLYEIALNNVGCHIEGDFSNACEEIISRLEGLKRYSMEKEGADNG
jgi:hypothetical protein